MGLIRGELEDLAFSYLEPEAYQELQKTVVLKRKEFEVFLTELQDTIRKRLEENGVAAEVEGRVKRLYSIHQKGLRQHRTVDQIYDLLAVRVITDTIRNCYAALGVIHQVWRPVPGRLRITSRCPGRICTSRSTRRSSMPGGPLKSRFAPRKCIASPNKEWPRTGDTRTARTYPMPTISASCGCDS